MMNSLINNEPKLIFWGQLNDALLNGDIAADTFFSLLNISNFNSYSFDSQYFYLNPNTSVIFATKNFFAEIFINGSFRTNDPVHLYSLKTVLNEFQYFHQGFFNLDTTTIKKILFTAGNNPTKLLLKQDETLILSNEINQIPLSFNITKEPTSSGFVYPSVAVYISNSP